MSQFVYFIGPAGSENGPIKIGVALDIDRRLKTLQIGHPTRLECYDYIEPCQINALSIEKCLHKMLKHRRIGGEWFDIARSEIMPNVQIAASLLDATATEKPS